MLDFLNALLALLHDAVVNGVGANEATGLKVLAGYILLDLAATLIFPAARSGAALSLARLGDFGQKVLGPFLILALLAVASKNIDPTVFGAFYAIYYAAYAAQEGKAAFDKLRAIIGLGPNLKANGAIAAGDKAPAA